MNTISEQEILTDKKLNRKIKFFYWSFNIRTEGLSFFIVVPFILLYVWINIQFTTEQLRLFNMIWPPAFVFGVIFVLVNNWIVLRPVLRYFSKFLKGQEYTQEQYARAKKRFLLLPYIHAVGAFFRWILLLGNAIVATTILAHPSTPQIVNMWTGAGICAILGVFSYFSITEAHVQDILNRGLFARLSGQIPPPRFKLLPRLTLMTLGAALLPAATLFAFFYITVETHNLGNASMYLKIAFLILLGFVAGMISPIFLNITIRKKVRTVTQFLDSIGRGNLESVPDNVVIEDEISQINHSVDDMREKLKEATAALRDLNMNLEQKVEERTEELQAAMEELEAMNENLIALNEELEQAYVTHLKDLKMAANVQNAFLPSSIPQSAEYDIAYVSRPMSVVSGDFFDFYVDGDRLRGVGIFDVSGHGISSGLLTIIAKSIIHRNFYESRHEKLPDIVKKINEELIHEIAQADKYLTGILLRFKDDIVEYSNNGHPDAFFKVSGKEKVGRVVNREGESIKGMFLGIADMNSSFDALSLRLHKGDCIFLFSDCLLESKNSAGEVYTENHIKDSLKRAPAGTAREIMDYLINDFDAFIGQGTSLQDDLTAIVIVRK